MLSLYKTVLSMRLTMLNLAGCFCALIYGYLCVVSQSEMNFWTLLTCMGMAATAVFAYWRYAVVQSIQPSISELIIWAMLFRVIGILGMPIMEDDYYRFLWDGYMLVEYGSPYGFSPDTFFGSDTLSDQFDNILSGINNPHIATIYGPICQWIFALGYLIAPGDVRFLQIIFSIFDMGIVFLLLKLAPPRNVLLYAWCPLIIKEFAFTAHTDVMAVFLMLAACFLMQRGHWKTMGAVLACAVASKIFALIIVPFLLVRNVRSWLPFLLSIGLLYAPFADTLFSENHGLGAMANGWIFNAPVYYLADNYLNFATTIGFINEEWLLKAVLGGSFTLFVTIYGIQWWLKPASSWPRGDLLYGLFLLIIPAVNAWYIVWLLPFAVIRPGISPWVASFALVFSYAIGLNLNTPDLVGYQQPIWALAIEYSLIYAAIAVDIIRSKRLRKDSAYSACPNNI